VPARISTKHKSTIIGSCLKIAPVITETRCALLTILAQSVTTLNAKPIVILEQELRCPCVSSLLSWKMCFCQAEQNCTLGQLSQVVLNMKSYSAELFSPAVSQLKFNAMTLKPVLQICTLIVQIGLTTLRKPLLPL
jgi:hypothetical protein